MTTNHDHAAVARRIEALLAKAASTTYAEEAEVCIAKAQELMARHTIDDAALRSSGAARTGSVVSRPVLVPRPYASARTALLGAIAQRNHCRLVLHGHSQAGQPGTLIGHAADVRYVDALFTVVSVHATRALFDADPGLRPRSYRHGFLLAYASRVAERLRAANEAAREQAEEVSGSSVALALVERWSAVDDAVRGEFPNVGRRRTTASSGAGFAHGRAAADAAPLAANGLDARPALPRGRA